jgi:DNA-binding CsgD family transcriptional regulator
MPTLGQVLHRAVDGTFAVDSRQRIIYWDRGCEDLLGRTSESALGKPCCDVLQGCDPATGASFCCHGCGIAQPDTNSGTRNSFSIQVSTHRDTLVQLSVNIVLIPANGNNTWNAAHLLHVGGRPDVLTSLSYALDKHSPLTVSRHNGIATKPRTRASSLTAREQEVLGLLAEGLTGAVIAKRLMISITTARNHLQHIQRKLGVHSQIEAVAYAYRHNLV